MECKVQLRYSEDPPESIIAHAYRGNEILVSIRIEPTADGRDRIFIE